MKKMVTVFILISIFLITITSIIVVFSKYREVASRKAVDRTIEEAKEINNNSYMGMEYLELSGLSEEDVKNIIKTNQKQKGYKKFKPEIDVTNNKMVRTIFQKELAVIILETELNSQNIKEVSILTDVNKYSYSFFYNSNNLKIPSLLYQVPTCYYFGD